MVKKRFDTFGTLWGLISQLSSTGTSWSCFTLLTTCGPCFELEPDWQTPDDKTIRRVKDCHCLVGSTCLLHMLLLSYSSSLSMPLTSAAMQGLCDAACLQLLGPMESFQPL